MRVTLFSLLLALTAQGLVGQTLRTVECSTRSGITVDSYITGDGHQTTLRQPLPLFSLLINESLYVSTAASGSARGDTMVFSFSRGVKGTVVVEKGFTRGWKATVIFENATAESLKVANVVPFGEGPDRVYITAAGPTTYQTRLSRTQLFRPGLGPIGVILPDNAWEMGFCDVPVTSAGNMVGIARRVGSERAEERRFRTILAPGGSVRYAFFLDEHGGDWHIGVRLMFQERWLYDLEKFDDTLFGRDDLKWIRHSYLLTLLFAWDEKYYDALKHRYSFEQFLAEKKRLLGDYDAFMVWPTWPRLGIDQRNQFDLYRDMPGGLKELRRQADAARQRGTKYFIAYNPWDASTRREDHLKGMEELVREISADGVVLDTWGESSKEFQAAADRVKPGIIMYSEGMAVPKDMPGIVAGRVHDALFLPPALNLNKVIKPDFAIFRVMQVQEGRLHREGALCLFNGYGAELNVMRTGRPDWMDEEYRYLGLIVKTLRENSDNFLASGWVPLLPTTVDSVWVNSWPSADKTVYTVYSARPEGFKGPLLEGPVSAERHYVSLWHHEELEPVMAGGKAMIPVETDGFSRAWLGTRSEGNVDCIAWLPKLLNVRLDGDSLFFAATKGTRILVSAGDPSYETRSFEFPVRYRSISLLTIFGRYEGKFVVQLFDEGKLLDERAVTLALGTPRLIARAEPTLPAKSAPEGMVEIPAAPYTFRMGETRVPNPVIPYPDFSKPRELAMKSFFIDTYPVTNAKFREFVAATHYTPTDTVNFLRHWVDGSPPKGLENHPVVWINLEDARVYARWAAKRLPTDIEWQYAAQGTDGRKYPWGNEFDSTRCNYHAGTTTPVDAFPAGKSPYGMMDCVGNVWQMTNDVYDNCSYYYVTMRGGSYYSPTTSEWYVRGGPWQIDQHQMLLLVGPGFNRNATVGFRCVRDASPKQSK